jgi:hypothetical protein
MMWVLSWQASSLTDSERSSSVWSGTRVGVLSVRFRYCMDVFLVHICVYVAAYSDYIYMSFWCGMQQLVTL